MVWMINGWAPNGGKMDGSVVMFGPQRKVPRKLDLEDELLSKMVKPSTAQTGERVHFKTSYLNWKIWAMTSQFGHFLYQGEEKLPRFYIGIVFSKNSDPIIHQSSLYGLGASPTNIEIWGQRSTKSFCFMEPVQVQQKRSSANLNDGLLFGKTSPVCIWNAFCLPLTRQYSSIC